MEGPQRFLRTATAYSLLSVSRSLLLVPELYGFTPVSWQIGRRYRSILHASIRIESRTGNGGTLRASKEKRSNEAASMRQSTPRLCLLMVVCLLTSTTVGQKNSPATLNSSTKLTLINAGTQWMEYRGRSAMKLVPLPGHEHAVNEMMMAVLADSDFKDGVIELDVSGARRAGYSTVEDIRGFKGVVGVSFRVQGEEQGIDQLKAETFYVRAENARLDNQFFRNSSTQYESLPEFPWGRLRKESPEVYEAYVDLEPGAWTKLKIEVSGTRARLYVNGAPQSCLIVNDLKHGSSQGKIALYARVSTDAYFANLSVKPGT